MMGADALLVSTRGLSWQKLIFGLLMAAPHRSDRFLQEVDVQEYVDVHVASFPLGEGATCNCDVSDFAQQLFQRSSNIKWHFKVESQFSSTNGDTVTQVVTDGTIKRDLNNGSTVSNLVLNRTLVVWQPSDFRRRHAADGIWIPRLQW
jgi:hypothetical protein